MAHAGDVHVGKVLSSAGYFGFIIQTAIGFADFRNCHDSAPHHVFDRLDDLLIATAAAKISPQVVANLLVRRLRTLFEQRFRAENKSRGAVAALQRAKLHPVQEAFMEFGALQCGYCTSGFILSAKALLDECPRPSEEQIRDYLAGNFCRCGCYQEIMQAVKNVAGKS